MALSRTAKVCLLAVCLVILAFILIEGYALGFFTTDPFLSEINKRAREQGNKLDINTTDIAEKYIPKGSKKETALNFLKERKFRIYSSQRKYWPDGAANFDECFGGTRSFYRFMAFNNKNRVGVCVKDDLVVYVWGLVSIQAI